MNKRAARVIGMAKDVSSLKPTLHECLDTFLAQSDTLMDGVLEGLQTAIKAKTGMAGRLADVDGAALCVDALVADRASVKKRFTESLHNGMFHGPGLDPAARAAVKFEDLRFFEEGQLDASIAHARIVEEIERATSELLPATHAIMSSLLGWVSVQPNINPIRPEVFAKGLADAFAAYATDDLVRERVYTVAAGYLGMGLAGLYRQNRDWLRSMGIEPAGLHTGEAMPSKGQVQQAAESSIAKTLLTLDRLRKLLTGQVDPETPQLASLLAATGGKDFLHTIPASMMALQDMKQVEALVAKLAEKANRPNKTPAELIKQKSLAVELRLGKQLGRHIGNEVIRLMVENLTQDERLLDPIRNLLQHLEPQLLKLAHVDPRFFSETTHPARRLIERVVQRSFGFAAVSDAGFVDFFKSVKLIMGSLTLPTDSVSQSFDDALELLETTWAKHDAEQLQRQQAAAKALLHAEQRNMLALRLADEMSALCAEKELPDTVVQFLQGPWAQALAERQLSGAPVSADFDGLASNLIWSVQKRLARKNPGRLVQIIPAMLRTMRTGLKSIGYTELLTERFLGELIELHEASLDGVVRKAADAVDLDLGGGAMAATEPFDSGTESDDSFWVGQQEGINIGFVDADAMAAQFVDSTGMVMADEPGNSSEAIDLEIGTWVEIMLNGHWTRANLKWTSPYKNLFMFVSAGGLAHSMTRRTLERLRASSMLRVVARAGVVEQALDGVAQRAARNSLKGDPSGDADGDHP